MSKKIEVTREKDLPPPRAAAPHPGQSEVRLKRPVWQDRDRIATTEYINGVQVVRLRSKKVVLGLFR